MMSNEARESVNTKVIHVSNLSDEVTGSDLIALALPFGQLTNLSILNGKGQALIEFSDHHSAFKFLDYATNSEFGLYANGQRIFAKLSSHKEIKIGAPNILDITQPLVPIRESIFGDFSQKSPLGFDPLFVGTYHHQKSYEAILKVSMLKTRPNTIGNLGFNDNLHKCLNKNQKVFHENSGFQSSQKLLNASDCYKNKASNEISFKPLVEDTYPVSVQTLKDIFGEYGNIDKIIVYACEKDKSAKNGNDSLYEEEQRFVTHYILSSRDFSFATIHYKALTPYKHDETLDSTCLLCNEQNRNLAYKWAFRAQRQLNFCPIYNGIARLKVEFFDPNSKLDLSNIKLKVYQFAPLKLVKYGKASGSVEANNTIKFVCPRHHIPVYTSNVINKNNSKTDLQTLSTSHEHSFEDYGVTRKMMDQYGNGGKEKKWKINSTNIFNSPLNFNDNFHSFPVPINGNINYMTEPCFTMDNGNSFDKFEHGFDYRLEAPLNPNSFDMITNIPPYPPLLLNTESLMNFTNEHKIENMDIFSCFNQVFSNNHHDVRQSSPVLLVSNIPCQLRDPDRLFTLFGVYGDVIRIKILYNKRDAALIQLKTGYMAQIALKYLDKIKVFDQVLRISPSIFVQINTMEDKNDGSTSDINAKPSATDGFVPSVTIHSNSVSDGQDLNKDNNNNNVQCGGDHVLEHKQNSSQNNITKQRVVTNTKNENHDTFDSNKINDNALSSPLTKDYTNSPYHRYRNAGSKNYRNIYPPSNTLHLSNIPEGVDESTLKNLFRMVAGHKCISFKFLRQKNIMSLVDQYYPHKPATNMFAYDNIIYSTLNPSAFTIPNNFNDNFQGLYPHNNLWLNHTYAPIDVGEIQTDEEKYKKKRQMAYITFETRQQAIESLILLHNAVIDCKYTLKVSFANLRYSNPPTPNL